MGIKPDETYTVYEVDAIGENAATDDEDILNYAATNDLDAFTYLRANSARGIISHQSNKSGGKFIILILCIYEICNQSNQDRIQEFEKSLFA